ncbi:hypothetical protein BGX38DRAFT_1251655 [Terfezia claveryi]|nr:hypothetical protein BGX38DRAFT_1251655 [Terfezia claveryi]
MAIVKPVHAFGSSIFRRDCVQCPEVMGGGCGTCLSTQLCTFTLQTCTQCAEAKCININSSGTGNTTDNSSSGSSAGPIAGGVIGGFAVLGLLGFFFWRHKNKQRKEREATAEKEASFGSSRAARASTHTVASISSTTTRASNVIQIGYLPGVMNRSAPSTPGQFIPPVPPLPGHGVPEIRYPQSPDQGTFFSADDILRASVYTTGDHDPRASVATTIYRNNAIVSPVAANVVRLGKAAVVTVKGGPSAVNTPQLGNAPPVPAVDLSQYDKATVPPSPAFSVGSTFLNKMNEKTMGAKEEHEKDHSNRLSVPRRKVAGRTVTAEAVVVESSVWEEESSDDENEPDHRRRTLGSEMTSDLDSPFSDTASFSDMPLPAGSGLPPLMTSAVRRVSVSKGKEREREKEDPSVGSRSSRGKSPFDDSNAVGQS